MSDTHAVATKNTKNGMAAPRIHKKSQPVSEMIPETRTGLSGEQFLLQRKENACACGGGCPRCVLQVKRAASDRPDPLVLEADAVVDHVVNPNGAPFEARTPEPPVQRQSENEEEEEEILQTKSLSDHITPLVQRQTDPEEQEELIQSKPIADRIVPLVQRQVEEEEEEEPAQTKSLLQRQAEDEEESLQGKFTTNETPAQLKDDTREAENRTGMPHPLKAGLEALSGMNLSGVRVHNNSAKPAQLNALAYTQGQDIHVGLGQEKHLPHEGWHAVQQMQGRVKPTMQAKGVSINDDTALEREADAMGARALQKSASSQNRDSQLAPVPPSAALSSSDSTSRTIQRAMKFEYQVKRNKLYRYDGKNKVSPLPRKYGPEDFLLKSKSGVRLESETNGQVEFETKWSRTWSDLKAQIIDAREMTKKMNDRFDIQGAMNNLFVHNGIKYSEFPFKTPHLGPGQGFKTNKKNVWIKNQKSGRYESNSEKHIAKIKVRSIKLDVKEKRNDKSEVIGTLDKFDEVKVLRIKGKWSKVKVLKTKREWPKDKVGWVVSEFIRPRRFGGWIDSGNNANRLLSRDTPLGSKEKILVDIRDRNWTAYIQTSESFALDQFGSFFEQFRTNSGGRFKENGKRKTRDIYDEVEGSVDRIMLANRKMMGATPDMKNFLLMVVYYIKLGGREQTVGEKKSAKFVFPLMSRTNFGSVYKLLSADEQLLFKSMLKDKRHGLLYSLGVRGKRRLLFKPHSGGKGPTIDLWLKGITEGEDLLSGKRYPAAMGRFRVEKEVGRQEGLIRFEARKAKGNYRAASEWLHHASEMFSKAMIRRGRDSGKGKTGLRVKKPKKDGDK